MHLDASRAMIAMPWYIALFVILSYGVTIYFVIRTIRSNRDKKYKSLIYRRVSFRDYGRILKRDFSELRADMGVKESLMAFQKFGSDFYDTVEKALSRNAEFKVVVSKYEIDSDEYRNMVDQELGWIHLISDSALEIGRVCTEVIKEYEDHHDTYDLDTDTMQKYIVVANMLQDQYHKLRQDDYIPKSILNDIEMIYRVFFDYFELVNANVEIL